MSFRLMQSKYFFSEYCFKDIAIRIFLSEYVYQTIAIRIFLLVHFSYTRAEMCLKSTHAQKCALRVCRFIVNNLKLVHIYQLQKYHLTDLTEMVNDYLKVERLERLANDWHNRLAKSTETKTIAATSA